MLTYKFERQLKRKEIDTHQRDCAVGSQGEIAGVRIVRGGGRHEKIGIVDGDMRCTRWQAGGHTFSVLQYYCVFRVSMGSDVCCLVVGGRGEGG